MKYFIITIDVEGDNLWDYKSSNKLTTENSIYVPRFQELCEEYSFIPVWLTNYEMAREDRYINYIKRKAECGLCEVGIHIHAWNNPPYYKLNSKYGGNSFLIEYPYDIMCAKFEQTYNLIKDKFGIKVTSHRAGRWAMDDRYFLILSKYGITVDCSYTPGISWKDTCGETMFGPDYTNVDNKRSIIHNVMEVPMTIRIGHPKNTGSIIKRVKNIIKKQPIWLRPAVSSADDMISLCNRVYRETETDYLEFMIHSSELMPQGSPYFKTAEDIEYLYRSINRVFSHVRSLGYKGVSLSEYSRISNDKETD